MPSRHALHSKIRLLAEEITTLTSMHAIECDSTEGMMQHLSTYASGSCRVGRGAWLNNVDFWVVACAAPAQGEGDPLSFVWKPVGLRVFQEEDSNLVEGSDVWAVKHGNISITALNAGLSQA